MTPSESEKFENLKQERDEAIAWVEKLQKETQTLTCVYCGKEYPPGTPVSGAPALTAHIKVCKKHPLREAEKEIERLKTENKNLKSAITYGVKTS